MDERLFGGDAPAAEGLAIAVVGAGGAGCASLARMRRQLGPTVSMFALDTSASALSRLPEGVAGVLLAGATFGGRGTAGEAEALAAALTEEPLALDLPQPAPDLVVLVGALGGGTGTAALPWLAERLAGLETILVGHLIQPLGLESQRALDLGERAHENLALRLNAHLTVSNDRLQGSRAEGTTLADAWRAGDRLLIDLLDRLVPPPAAVLHLDPADALGFLRHGGALHFGQGRGTGPERLEAALEAAWGHGILRPADHPAHRALLWLRGAGVSAGEHRAAVATVAGRLAPAQDGSPGIVRVGVEEGPQGLEASLLASPLAMPTPLAPAPGADHLAPVP